MRKMLLSLIAICCLAGVGMADQTVFYDYELPGVTILGEYPGNAVDVTLVTGAPDQVFEGNQSMRVDSNSGSTTQAYIVYVDDIQTGDVIHAGFWVYDDTPGISPSGRIWAHYCDNDDINDYAGSASGDSRYSGPDWPTDGFHPNWWFLSATWVVQESGPGYDPRTGLVIELRNYGGGTVYLDDVYCTAPDHTTIHIGGMNNFGVPADFPEFDPPLTCESGRADIVGETVEYAVEHFRNPYADCVVDVNDVQAIADLWTYDASVNVDTDPAYSTHETYQFDWEDAAIQSDPNLTLVWVDPTHSSGNGPFNNFNYSQAELTSTEAFGGTGNSIACIDNGSSQTGQLYVAWIKNLDAGDKIAASVMLKDAGDAGSCRLWASYARSDGDYAGSSGHGDIDFSDTRFAQSFDNGWAKHSAEWTFEASEPGYPPRDQMVITIRTYTTDDTYGSRVAGWADNLIVTVPAGAEVVFPSDASAGTVVVHPDGNTVGAGDLVTGSNGVICPVRPYADLNHDCKVGIADFAEAAAEWYMCGWSDPAVCPPGF